AHPFHQPELHGRHDRCRRRGRPSHPARGRDPGLDQPRRPACDPGPRGRCRRGSRNSSAPAPRPCRRRGRPRDRLLRRYGAGGDSRRRPLPRHRHRSGCHASGRADGGTLLGSHDPARLGPRDRGQRGLLRLRRTLRAGATLRSARAGRGGGWPPGSGSPRRGDRGGHRGGRGAV
ncbi:MAG: Hydantoin racemase, partial [uncultured Rubellimicrobium sp.]